MTAKGKAAATIADGIAAARADLDELRDRIGDLLAERKEIERAPCDRAEAERRVGEIISQARAKELFYSPSLFAPDNGGVGAFFDESLRRDPLAALATVCPDGLAAAFLEHHPGGGLSPDARAARLAELERDLEAAEIAEEVAAREIEAATGGMIARRLDADPAVLLAPDHELEGETT